MPKLILSDEADKISLKFSFANVSFISSSKLRLNPNPLIVFPSTKLAIMKVEIIGEIKIDAPTLININIITFHMLNAIHIIPL